MLTCLGPLVLQTNQAACAPEGTDFAQVSSGLGGVCPCSQRLLIVYDFARAWFVLFVKATVLRPSFGRPPREPSLGRRLLVRFQGDVLNMRIAVLVIVALLSGCDEMGYVRAPPQHLVVKAESSANTDATERVLSARLHQYLPSFFSSMKTERTSGGIVFAFERGAPATSIATVIRSGVSADRVSIVRRDL
jgi:hypothetical protein